MKEFNLKTPNLIEGNNEDKRQEILDYFNRTFELDSKLYETIKDDDTFYMRADPLRHPLIFYYGHTCCFFINKLVLAGLLPTHINPHFESIFAIGVDEMSWDDLNEENYNWPTVEKVRKYRNKVKTTITELIKDLPLELPIDWKSSFWPILMGIEHQNIHIETSSVLIRQLPVEKLKSGIFYDICKDENQNIENELLPIEGKEMSLGKPYNHKYYGWDLEYGTYRENVRNFKASIYLVSNAEFLDFVVDNGYKNKSLWTDEGWAWCKYKEAEHPQFWIKENENYKLRLLTEIVPMKWNFPAEINYLEAKAFCNWKSIKTGKKLRLPTEAEWNCLVEHCGVKDVEEWDVAPGNINLEHYASSCPVNKFAFDDFFDVIGNVWQWTETPITGYPGFKVHPLYDDFSTPTFDGKHNIIKGGSWISTGNEATLNARYAFRRHFYQHAGFRYIESDYEPEIRVDSYETDEEVSISCEQNFGDDYFGMKKIPLQILEVLKENIENTANKKFLDLNCKTGRLAFEVTKIFKDVTALNKSARFIRPAIELQKKGLLRYVIKDEGELQIYKDVLLENLGLQKDLNNLLFMQDDAMKLKSHYTNYDVILAFNLLEELYKPKAFLSEIHQRLNEGGILILGSTYEWDESICQKENWLGGLKKDGEPVKSINSITNILSDNFECQNKPFKLSYPIRQSSHNFEVKISEVTLWRKK